MFRISKRLIGVLIVLLLITGWVVYLLSMPRRLGRSTVVWSHASSSPVDADRFMVVLFPRTVLEESEGDLWAKRDFVKRAILVSLAETQREVITVFVDANSDEEVASNAFTARPPINSRSLDLNVEKLNQAIRAWQNETDWKKVSYTSKRTSGENAMVALKVYTKRGDVNEYEYEVDLDGHVIPHKFIWHRRRF